MKDWADKAVAKWEGNFRTTSQSRVELTQLLRAIAAGEREFTDPHCGVDLSRQDQEFIAGDGVTGDCVRACTASILGIPIVEVPHFLKDDKGLGWWAAWNEWVNAKGFVIVEIDPRMSPPCRHLAAGPSKHTNRPSGHIVVMDGEKLYHDPNPSRAGIITKDRVYLIVPRSVI